jgi:hypothetical protein
MTDLAPDAATDSEAFVVAWLSPFFADLNGLAGIKRKSGDPLPFGLVREVDQHEYEQQLSSLPLVSVHWMAATEQDCIELARDGHRRMSVLALDPTTEVEVDGRVVVLEWLETVHAPIWVDYTTNQVFRKTSRYRMSLGFQEADDDGS